jgi:membrane-associated phospholipid phosphatase
VPLRAPFRTTHRVVSAVERFDGEVLRWVEVVPHGPVGGVLRGTARAADVLAPWILTSVGLLASPWPRAGPALVRGWLAMGVSALVEDAILKPAVHRDRPDVRRLPPGQRRSTAPSTSAFPSGHVGAATAFAVAVPPEVPRSVRGGLAVLAAVTAYARVYTGRHYASDALVGLAVGAVAGRLAGRAARARHRGASAG